MNAESSNSLTRTVSIGVKCTSAQPGSLIVLVTRLFMCDKRFRYGPLHSNLHIAPAFATFCPIGELLFSLSPLKVRSLSFSFSLFLPLERSTRFDRSLSRSYYFNRFCCAIATREFENCVYFLSFLGRFEICYFSIVCKFYIACYTLLEMKMECLNGNWEMEIGENL